MKSVINRKSKIEEARYVLGGNAYFCILRTLDMYCPNKEAYSYTFQKVLNLRKKKGNEIFSTAHRCGEKTLSVINEYLDSL